MQVLRQNFEKVEFTLLLLGLDSWCYACISAGYIILKGGHSPILNSAQTCACTAGRDCTIEGVPISWGRRSNIQKNIHISKFWRRKIYIFCVKKRAHLHI